MVKRLDQVIVGTGIQTLDLVLPAPPRGKDQNRDIVTLVANLVDDLETRHFRQSQVDDGNIGGILLDQVKSFVAIIRTIDRKTLGFQTIDDLLLDIDIVFNDYRSHGNLALW